jgi:NADPH-dependent 2,4-dienoyl-CoA reductase/sulfur reductase-like enzyme
MQSPAESGAKSAQSVPAAAHAGRVAVVGSGVAGLSAAYLMHRNGRARYFALTAC